MSQHIFLFDYIKFKEEAAPFVKLADVGEYKPIIAKANEIATLIDSEDWILEDMGTTLKAFDKWQENAEIGHITGFSFLVLLSQFLKLSPFPTPGLGNIAKALISSNWSQKEIELLKNGMSTTVLLKPSEADDMLKRPPVPDSRWHDPSYYYWWLRPEYAFHTGWWDIQQLGSLREKLLEAKQVVENADIHKLNFHPSISKQTIYEHYERTIQLFGFATDQEFGLLTITR